MGLDVLAQALLLATLNKALIDYIAEPVQRKWPAYDLWWLGYVALVTGFVMAWYAGVDFISGRLTADPMVGRLLSCLTVGAGSTLINRVFVGFEQPVAATRGLKEAPVVRRKYRGW